MRSSRFFCPTSREAPKDCGSLGERLLLRAGLARRSTSGLAYLPLGTRALRRLEALVGGALEKAGALEACVPGGCCELLRLLGKEHLSYRDLPLTFYLPHEAMPTAPRQPGLAGGLTGGRGLECCGLALDATPGASLLDQTLAAALAPLQLRLITAEASVAGEAQSLVFPSSAGELSVLQCGQCRYAALDACARGRRSRRAATVVGPRAPQPISTPGARTVESVCAALGVSPQRLIKTLIYEADGCFVAALVRGDRQLEELKLAATLGAVNLRLATPEQIRDLTGAAVGFSGPVGLPGEVRVVADFELEGLTGCVAGANQTDTHLLDVAVGIDFTPERFADLRVITAGDACPCCDTGTLTACWGREVACLSRARPSESRELVVADSQGHSRSVRVQTLSLYLEQCLTAVLEAHSDANGIVWPTPAIAPFAVAILLLDASMPDLRQAAESMLAELRGAGFACLLDDRSERPGAKFADADLLGHPVVVIVGKRLVNEGLVEVRRRADRLERVVTPAAVLPTVRGLLTAESTVGGVADELA